MFNFHSVLLRFAEPFMDAKFSKVFCFLFGSSIFFLKQLQIDRIDPYYLARSMRVDVKEETRIKATTDEVNEWTNEVLVSTGAKSI